MLRVGSYRPIHFRAFDAGRFDPDCSFTLNLDGTGSGVIRAIDGSLLNSGSKDYWTTFVVVG